MFSSLTTSVLAYLQADIPVNIIQHQIHLNYLIICERIFVFQQLYHFLHENKDIEFGRFKKILVINRLTLRIDIYPTSSKMEDLSISYED